MTRAYWIASIVTLLLIGSDSAGQTVAPQQALPIASEATRSGDAPSPDVEIRARATAREIIFHEVGNVTVRWFGGPSNQNVWRSDRTNFPLPVPANVLFRDIGIVLTISSTLPSVEEVVDQALSPASTAQPVVSQPPMQGSPPRQDR